MLVLVLFLCCLYWGLFIYKLITFSVPQCPGLKELTLSANPAVTPMGWAYLAIAMSSANSLRVLNVDYNRLGDTGVCMLAVSAAASKSLEVLDLESVGVSDQGAKVS